jgi:hypothetical protein
LDLGFRFLFYNCKLVPRWNFFHDFNWIHLWAWFFFLTILTCFLLIYCSLRLRQLEPIIFTTRRNGPRRRYRNRALSYCKFVNFWAERDSDIDFSFFFPFRVGWTNFMGNMLWERESKKAGPGYFDYKVCIVVLSRIFIFYANI